MSSGSLQSGIGTSGLIVLVALLAAPAFAQDAASPGATRPAEQSPATPAAPSTPTAVQPAPAGAPAPATALAAAFARFAEIDKLRPQGQTTNFPGAYDSILADRGGWRSRLAERGLDFRGSAVTPISRNLLPGGPKTPQRFSVQKTTISNASSASLSWRFAGDDADISQLSVTGQALLTNWQRVGPTQVQLVTLQYFQTFLDRRIEVTAGFNTNIVNFVGIFAGGNPLLAGGLAATIPAQVGMSVSPAPTPTLNVQINGDGGLYAKSGIQRSVSPNGIIEEARDNGIGLRLTRKGARPLLIQEVGVLRAASPESRQMWLRGGVLYNLTRYDRFDGQAPDRNWAAYALADYQVVRSSPDEPYRGVYAGFSALFASDKVNVYRRTVEGRLYAIGLLPSRPLDSMTLTLGYNGFSRDAGRALEAVGQPAERYQWSISGLYTLHAGRGIYLGQSLTYLRNPSFVGNFKPALTAALSANLLF